MVISRRHLLALTAAGLAAAGLAACSDDGAPAAGKPLTIGLTYVPNIQFAPYYVALEGGFFEKEGVAVELRHHGQDEDLLGALAKDTEQLVVAGADEMMQGRAAGTKVTTVQVLYQRYPVRLIVPQASAIAVPADLRGHRVGVPGRFGETWFGLVAMLQEAGLTESDVTVDTIGYTQQAALLGGHVDAVMGFANNDVVQLTEAGLDVRGIELGDVPLVGIGLGARDDVLADRTADVAAVARAVRAATFAIVADPQVGIDAAKKQIPGVVDAAAEKQMRATLAATVPLYGTDSATWGQPDGALFERMATFLQEAGLLAGPVSPSEAWAIPGADGQ